MKIAEKIGDLRHELAAFRDRERIAFVPTMGCLHDGHLSLIRKARLLADVVVVSIYVNPLQFGAGEDLDAYPRPFEDDVALCKAEGVDLLFHPYNLYPEGGPKVTLGVKELDSVLCGSHRPGHFDGVVTVVNILFNIVQPHIAIFGEKDWQQLAIIRQMVSDLHMPVEIVGAPIVREVSGLAMSSRNRYLSEAELAQAAHISRSLQTMQQLYAVGEMDISSLLRKGRDELSEHGIETEYLEIRNATTLQPAGCEPNGHNRIFIAAKIGKARLIDNMPLETAADSLLSDDLEK